MNKMASPLFILRKECEKDLEAVIRRLGAIGFDGIEFLGFFGHSAKEIRRMLDENHMEALGNHVPYAELMADAEGIFQFHQEVGCQYLTVADVPLDDFASVSKSIDRLSECARAHGIRLLYHNHDHELVGHTEGQENLAFIMDHTKPESLALEPDLGWIEIGGGDAARYLKTYGKRCPVIHLKDYFTDDFTKVGRERGFAFRPTGYGMLNLPKLMPLCLACEPEWFVMDHDLATVYDSYEELKMSLAYTRSLVLYYRR